MKNVVRRGCGMLLGILLIGQTAGGAALAEGSEDENLLQFSYTDSEGLLNEFEMGNLLFFTGGTVEQEDNGVIDDSVLVEEGETGETGETGESDETGEGGEEPTEMLTGIGRIIGNNISLRSEPDTDAQAVAQLNEGATLTIIAKDGQWLHVTFGILEGWVHNDYVFEVTETGLNGTVLRDGVNLRSDGNLEAEVIAQLNAGTGVQVTDYINGWYMVNFSGNTGFIRNDCITVTGTFTGESETRMLKSGMSGDAVTKAQTELKKRGFFIGTVTGDYGPKTERAVKEFQAEAKIEVDGVIGARTMELLYGNNNIRVTIATASQVKGRVQMTEWSKVNGIIPRGKQFKVIDVRTGVSWMEQRLGGYLHIDAEPVTANDTQKLKSVYGGSWTWNRRPVWVIYGSYVFAASMNGMPHASESIGSGNNFNGHHCYHFYKSRTHGTNSLDSRHQACVLEAYNKGK